MSMGASTVASSAFASETSASIVDFDREGNANEIRKKELLQQVGQLQEERIKLDQEHERISF
jgi:hypothetical protein